MGSENFVKRPVFDGSGVDPIQRFSSRKLTRKENVVKRAIESYRVSDVDNTEVLYFGGAAGNPKACPIDASLDLPDATCDGLVFKQRLVRTETGDCLLLARWKPDRYMRRSAPERSQRWFVEKELFPTDATRFFARIEKQAETMGDAAAEPGGAQPAAPAEE